MHLHRRPFMRAQPYSSSKRSICPLCNALERLDRVFPLRWACMMLMQPAWLLFLLVFWIINPNLTRTQLLVKPKKSYPLVLNPLSQFLLQNPRCFINCCSLSDTLSTAAPLSPLLMLPYLLSPFSIISQQHCSPPLRLHPFGIHPCAMLLPLWPRSSLSKAPSIVCSTTLHPLQGVFF